MSEVVAQPPATEAGDVVLAVRGVAKAFPGVVALDSVDLEVRAGELHVLLGENGAGKSTLIRILAGAETPDAGEIELYGQPAVIRDPLQAQRQGISTIYQEFNLVPQLSVAENIYLGHYPRGVVPGTVSWRRLFAQTTALLGRLGMTGIPVRAPVAELSVAQQQMVEIAKALSIQARIIVMDEPTASLTPTEVAALFATMNRLKASGIALIFVTHRLEEAMGIGDRATVLRGGRVIGTVAVAQQTVRSLIGMMVGRELNELYTRQPVPPGDELLRVEALGRPGWFSDVSFSVRAGEIVGLAGLVGAGRTSVVRAVAGADRFETGRLFVRGRSIRPRSPRDMLRAGVALLPEDRKAQGLVLMLSVQENIGLASLGAGSRAGLVDFGRQRQLAARYIHDLAIRTPSARVPVRQLSGGNQQKVVLSRYLARAPQVLIFDEPTRGIDVGAKVEIYELMNLLTAAGHGIVLVSSELPELLGMSDRILVMAQGRATGEFVRGQANEEEVLHAMFDQPTVAA
jgi:ribose transport system ATP-binding protein